MVSGADESFHSTGILIHRGHMYPDSVQGMTLEFIQVLKCLSRAGHLSHMGEPSDKWTGPKSPEL